MLGRSFVALLVAAAVVAAPTVARTRLFCRFTGIEIPASACNDEAKGTSQEWVRERCCEHRVQAPLAVAKSESISHGDGVFITVAVELHWFAQFTSAARPVLEASPPSRPPLSATRILLI